MAKGKYEDEYNWAKAHPTHPKGMHLLALAVMYSRAPCIPLIGLIAAAARDIRVEMDKTAK